MKDTTILKNVCNSLTENGFQVTNVNWLTDLVLAVDNEGNEITVIVRPDGYCRVVVDDFVCTNMSQPYQVGECARLRRHVAMFESAGGKRLEV